MLRGQAPKIWGLLTKSLHLYILPGQKRYILSVCCAFKEAKAKARKQAINIFFIFIQINSEAILINSAEKYVKYSSSQFFSFVHLSRHWLTGGLNKFGNFKATI